MDKHDVTKLEAKIKNVSEALAGLARGGEERGPGGLSELVSIIHKPGWTTVARPECTHHMDHLERRPSRERATPHVNRGAETSIRRHSRRGSWTRRGSHSSPSR